MSSDFTSYLSEIEAELRSCVAAPGPESAPLYNMMAYHLGWMDAQFHPTQAYGGKRVRPLLCLLSCCAAGGDWHMALPAAVALELVHSFSLVHDDIQDNSPTRRGRATVWTLWGLPQGITVGDAILILARLALARLTHRGTAPEVLLRANDILDRSCLLLCQGQYLDIAFEGRLDVSEESYLEMVGGKTAALLAASSELGALIAGAGHSLERYRQFGWHLGLAFQMADDLLGVWGDPAVTGKPVADDIRSRKMTLPVIFALRDGQDGRELARLYRQDSLTGADVSHAVRILERSGARDYVQRLAARHEADALASLEAAQPQDPAATLLRRLAASVIARER